MEQQQYTIQMFLIMSTRMLIKISWQSKFSKISTGVSIIHHVTRKQLNFWVFAFLWVKAVMVQTPLFILAYYMLKIFISLKVYRIVSSVKVLSIQLLLAWMASIGEQTDMMQWCGFNECQYIANALSFLLFFELNQ